MDILEEIDETINDKKGKWNYTPMREKSETDALIDELLKEFSSDDKTAVQSNYSNQMDYNIKNETEERREFESSMAEPQFFSEPEPEFEPDFESDFEPEAEFSPVEQPDKNESTQIFSRKDIENYDDDSEDEIPQNNNYDEYDGSRNDDYSGYGNGGFDDDYYDENDFDEDCDKIQTDELDDDEYAEFEEFIDRKDKDLRVIKPKDKKSIPKTVLRLICTAAVAAFTIIGILSSAIYCLEQLELSPSDIEEKNESLKEEMCRVIYPFVTTGIDLFDSPETLAEDDLVKLSLFEIIINLNGNLNVFKDSESDEIIIPHSQVEYAVSKLLGIEKKVEPCDIKYAALEIKYDKDKKGYIIPEHHDVYTLYPVVTNVKEQDGIYTVSVECFHDAPKWTEGKKTVPSEKVVYTLKKTSEYYNVLSARII